VVRPQAGAASPLGWARPGPGQVQPRLPKKKKKKKKKRDREGKGEREKEERRESERNLEWRVKKRIFLEEESL